MREQTWAEDGCRCDEGCRGIGEELWAVRP